MQEKELKAYSDRLASLSDEEIDLAFAAIALAAPKYPQRSLERYGHHIKKIYEDVGLRHADLLEAGAEDNLATRIATLKHIIHDKYEYLGDKETYDSLQNANMIEVIERRKGLPVAISILYLAASHAQGWEAEGLNFPAHFVIRMTKDSERMIIDPFNDMAILDAAGLRHLVKTFIGGAAELSADYYESVSKIDVLIRLQNNLKLRLISIEDYEEALAVVEQMQKVAPKEKRFLLDQGVLLAKLNEKQRAIDALEAYLEGDLTYHDKHDVETFIAELYRSLK
jgi:regulator of sirC expression with transglutaminase-like and TPR domain